MATLEILIKARDESSKVFGGVGGVLRTSLAGGALAVGGAFVGASAAILDFAGDTNQALGNLQAQLGISAEDAERFGDIATDVFANNFGASVTEAAGAVAILQQKISGLDDTGLQNATEAALALEDAFGIDLTTSAGAAAELMRNFGLTSQEAFDFIARGAQEGLPDDFLDTIREYGGLFAQGGVDAAGFFNIMSSGAAEGTLGTDKAADMFKEFTIRMSEGGDAAREALGMLGPEAAGLIDQVAGGQVSMGEAFQTVLGALAGVGDPLTQFNAGVGLMGGQFEDMGVKAALGVSDAGLALEDMAGSTDKLMGQYTGFGAMLEGFGRQTLVAFGPLADQALGLANEAMPRLQEVFGEFAGKLSATLGPAMTIVDDAFTRIAQAFGSTEESVSGLDILIAGLSGVLDAVVIGIMLFALGVKTVADFIEGGMGLIEDFRLACVGIGEAIGGIPGQINDLVGSFTDMVLPSLFTPGSPSPAELAFLGLAEAMHDVTAATPDFGGLSAGQSAGAQVGGGGGSGEIASLLQAILTAIQTGGGRPIQIVLDGRVIAEVVGQHLGNQAQTNLSFGGLGNL